MVYIAGRHYQKLITLSFHLLTAWRSACRGGHYHLGGHFFFRSLLNTTCTHNIHNTNVSFSMCTRLIVINKQLTSVCVNTRPPVGVTPGLLCACNTRSPVCEVVNTLCDTCTFGLHPLPHPLTTAPTCHVNIVPIFTAMFVTIPGVSIGGSEGVGKGVESMPYQPEHQSAETSSASS